jgi:hypothetical protein
MRHSEQWGQVAGALAKAQAEFTPVPKSKTAKVKTKAGYEYEYKYADLADCLKMALPLIAKNGIALLQPHELIEGRLRVSTILIHESGEWMQSDGIEISEEGDPQQFGAESTYFRRYDGCSFIGVAPDEDTDAQQAGQRTRRTPAEVIPKVTPQQQRPISDPPKPSESAPSGPFLLADDLLQCVILGVTEKATKGNKPYLAVTFNGRVDGFNWASNWHQSLTPILKSAVGKPINIRLTRKLSEDGRSVQYLNIEDVLWLDGQDYEDGKPVTLAQELENAK